MTADAKLLADRLDAMLAQAGHQDYSMREFISGVREIADALRGYVSQPAGRAQMFKEAMHSYIDAAQVEKARAERAEAALRAVLPFIDDAADVQNLFPDSAASDKCRAAVAEARATLAAAPTFISSQHEENP